MPASFRLPSVADVPSSVVAVSDPGSTRLVYAMIAALALVGVVLVVLGVWLILQTRHDPVALAPLERMGDGGWRRRDPATQQRLLDEVRPEGAEPLREPSPPPEVDDEFGSAARPVPSLDDLGPPIPGSPAAEDTPSDRDDVDAEDEGHDGDDVDAQDEGHDGDDGDAQDEGHDGEVGVDEEVTDRVDDGPTGSDEAEPVVGDGQPENAER